MHIGHPRITLTPIDAMLESHVLSTRDQGRQIFGIMRGTRTTTKQGDRVIHERSMLIFEAFKLFEEISQLFAQKQVVLRKFQLTIFIPGVR